MHDHPPTRPMDDRKFTMTEARIPSIKNAMLARFDENERNLVHGRQMTGKTLQRTKNATDSVGVS